MAHQTSCYCGKNSNTNNQFITQNIHNKYSHNSNHSRDCSQSRICDSDANSFVNSEAEIEKVEEDELSRGKRRRLKLVSIKNYKIININRWLLSVAIGLWCLMAAFGPIYFRSPKRNTAATVNNVAAANEMFDEANETPTGGGDAFNDDDDDDDGAMDASSSNDYPEAEGGGEDPDDDPDGGESRQGGSWLVPGAQASPRRTRRDMDDVASELQRRLALEAKRRSIRLKRPEDMEFSVDDGDEDAWVHDGVDDIHIDPETRQAASQLAHDERSIDAEYEPHQGDDLVNGTRITTISEVIPMRRDHGIGLMGDGDANGSAASKESGTRISTRYAHPPTQEGASLYLPAAYLSLEQAVRLMDGQANVGGDYDGGGIESSRLSAAFNAAEEARGIRRLRRWTPPAGRPTSNRHAGASMSKVRGRHRVRAGHRRTRAASSLLLLSPSASTSAACRQFPLTNHYQS